MDRNIEVSKAITSKIIEKVKEWKAEGKLKAIDRDVNGFMSVFKDSLFEYNDGIVLAERFYKDTFGVKVEYKEVAVINDEDTAIIEELKALEKEMPDTKDLTEDQIKEYDLRVQEMCERTSKIMPDYEKVGIEYYDRGSHKIRLKSITDMSDLEIEARATLATSLALSMYQSLFFESEFPDGMSVIGVDHSDYVDILIVPYSTELEKSTNGELIKGEEIDGQ